MATEHTAERCKRPLTVGDFKRISNAACDNGRGKSFETVNCDPGGIEGITLVDDDSASSEQIDNPMKNFRRNYTTSDQDNIQSGKDPHNEGTEQFVVKDSTKGESYKPQPLSKICYMENKPQMFHDNHKVLLSFVADISCKEDVSSVMNFSNQTQNLNVCLEKHTTCETHDFNLHTHGRCSTYLLPVPPGDLRDTYSVSDCYKTAKHTMALNHIKASESFSPEGRYHGIKNGTPQDFSNPQGQPTVHLNQSTKHLYHSTKHLDQSSKFQDQSKLQDCSNSRSHSKIMLTTPQNLMNIKSTSDPGKGSKLKVDELADRLKTFIIPPPWEGSLDAKLMAEAGFAYTGQEDLVYCFSCNIKLDGWTKHMDPLLRHKEKSPTCSFVRQQLQIIKGEKGKVKSVVAPSKPLNARQTASIGQLQSSTLFSSKPIHTVVTGLDEPRSSYSSRGGDDFFLSTLPINSENYGSEAERIRSFVGWPLNESVHPEQLARVGFVYTGEGSLVQCFQCGVRYRNWLKGDIPLSVHQRCNPRCAFLHTLTAKSKSVEEQRPSFSYIQPESMLPTTQSKDITLEFPDYTDQTTRLQSFKYWGGVLPKEELAEAGFYMIARRDVVRCFSCRVVLQDWEKSDNVIDEHRKHSPNCTFLKTHLSSISASASIDKTYSIEKSIEPKSRNYQSSQFDTTVTSSTLDIRHPPSIGKSSHEPSLPGFIMTEGLPRSNDNEGEAIQGMYYPPSWRSNPPTMSPPPPPGGSDSEESVSSQKKLGYDAMTSLQQSNDITSKKLIIVSGTCIYS